MIARGCVKNAKEGGFLNPKSSYFDSGYLLWHLNFAVVDRKHSPLFQGLRFRVVVMAKSS